MVKKVPAMYRTQRFINVFANTRWTLRLTEHQASTEADLTCMDNDFLKDILVLGSLRRISECH
jgi:hypothetical protein